MKDGTLVNRVVRWSSGDGVNYAAYFAIVEGEVVCVRLEIGALANADGRMPKVGERLRESPELLRGLRSEDLERFGLNSMIGRSHEEWVAFLEEVADSPEIPGEAVAEAVRILPLAKDARRASTPGPSSMTRQQAEARAQVYLEAVGRGKDPVQVLANTEKVSERTARRWVKALREEFEVIG